MAAFPGSVSCGNAACNAWGTTVAYLYLLGQLSGRAVIRRFSPIGEPFFRNT